MLKNEASGSALVGEIDSLVSGLGLKTVEATTGTYQGSASMTVILYKSGEEINTDDLTAAYNLIYPRYSILLGDRDLQLEVSSPGLQRNIKDTMEFSVFVGRDVRCYSVSRSAYAIGRIGRLERQDLISMTFASFCVKVPDAVSPVSKHIRLLTPAASISICCLSFMQLL